MRLFVPFVLAAFTIACSGIDPETELSQALSSFEAGDFRTASIHISNVLQADAQHADARVLRGRIALALGDAYSARRDLEQALQRGASPESVAIDLADAAIMMGDGPAAIAVLEGSKEVLHGSPQYWTRMGDALSLIGQLYEARAAYAQSQDLAPASARSLIGQAKLAIRLESDVDYAEALLSEAVEVSGEEAYPIAARGAFYFQNGRLSAAIEDFEEAARRYGARAPSAEEAAALGALVEAHLAVPSVDKAEETAKRLSSRLPNSTIAAYSQALVAYRQGRLDEAARLAQGIVREYPEDPLLRALLGAIQLDLGNLGQAEQQLLAALARAPADVRAARLLAETRIRQGRPQAALEPLRQFVDDGVDPHIGRLAAAASLQAGDAGAAARFLEAALERNPNDKALQVELARVYLYSGRADDAAYLLTEAFREPEGDEAVWGSLLMLPADLRSGDSLAGRERAAELQHDFPGNADILAAVSSYYHAVGDISSAARAASAAVEANPRSENAWLSRVRLELAQNEQSTARESLREAVDALPESLALRSALGRLEMQLGAAPEAGLIGQALQRDFETSAAGYALEGEAYLAEHRYDDAAARFRHASDRQPSWQFLSREVLALRLAGREPDVEDRLRTWVDSNPGHLEGRLALAAALQNGGQPHEALAQYERLVAMDGNNVVALNNAAWLRNELGTGDALAFARRAYELAPDYSEVLDTLGWILVGQNREQEGIEYLQLAAQLAVHVPEIRYHMAHALARLGRAAEARQELEALLGEQTSFDGRDAAEALLQSL